MNKPQVIKEKLIELTDTASHQRLTWERLIDIASLQLNIKSEIVRSEFLILLEAEIFAIDDTPLGGVMINIKNSKHKSTRRQFVPG